MKKKTKRFNPRKYGLPNLIISPNIYQGLKVSLTGHPFKSWEYSVCYDPESIKNLFKPDRNHEKRK